MLTPITVAFFHWHEAHDWIVTARDADGREYLLLDENGTVRKMSFHTADCVCERVKAAGQIDVNFLSCRTPYGTTAWLIDGMEQRQIEDEKYPW